ncbi:MAG: hypothetical protein EOO08_11650 [Chitinophagaceae bacterium]|nr:MAG: hypothetical protein EOO08_11650 [Chitinophagaceae bacterium]
MSQNLREGFEPAEEFLFDSWPGMDAGYYLAEGPRLVLQLRLDASRYDPETDTMWEMQLQQDATQYAALLLQWNTFGTTARPISIAVRTTLATGGPFLFGENEFEATRAFLRGITSYLEGRAQGAEVPPPSALELAWPVVAPTIPEQALLEMLVTLEVDETQESEDGESVEIRSRRTELPVAPLVYVHRQDTAPWQAFAASFALAFPPSNDSVLVPAIPGLPPAAPGEAGSGLWILRLGTGLPAALALSIAPTILPLALPPWSQELLSATVTVPRYESGKGLSGFEKPRQFSNIDLNVWVRGFFDSLDSVIDGGGDTDRLIALREDLAARIASRLIPVYPNANTSGVQAAVSAYEQRLKNKLSHCDDTVVGLLVTATGLPGGKLFLAAHYQDDAAADAPPQDVHFAPGDAEHPGFVTVFVKPVPDRAITPLIGALHISHVGISTADSYEESDLRWLRLLATEATEAALLYALPDADVPLPLRVLPTQVHLLSQHTSGVERVEQIEDALTWQYFYDYSAGAALQDTLHGLLDWNVPQGAAHSASTDAGDFFTALAAFHHCRMQIEADRVAGSSTDDPDANARVSVALAAYEQLATAVAAGWPTQHRSPKQAASSPTAFPFVVQESAEPDGILRIHMKQPEGSLAIEVFIDGYDPVPVGDATDTWNFINAEGRLSVEASRSLERRIGWNGLHALKHQNARATVRSRRNEILNGRVVDPSFTMQTNPQTFDHPAAPQLSTARRFDAFSWMEGSGPRALERLLGGLFRKIIPAGAGNQICTLQCSFASPLAQGGPEVTLPVLLVPRRAFREGADFEGDEAFVTELAAAIRTSMQGMGPDLSESGSFVFELSFFASTGAAVQPLVQFHDIRIARQLIR